MNHWSVAKQTNRWVIMIGAGFVYLGLVAIIAIAPMGSRLMLSYLDQPRACGQFSDIR